MQVPFLITCVCFASSVFTVTCQASEVSYSGNTLPVKELSVNELGIIKTTNPAFLTLDNSQVDNPALLVSSFSVNLFSKDKHSVSRIADLPNVIKKTSLANIEALDNSLVWPNQTQAVSSDLFGNKSTVVANGFFDVIPFKHNSTGSLSLIPDATHQILKLTKDKKGYYYHKAQWVDLHGDGQFGFLTARTNSTPKKTKSAELVFINPTDKGADVFPWHEEVIYKGGPDVGFDVADLDHDGVYEIYASEFFKESLAVVHYSKGIWQQRVIDSTIGRVFDVEVTSLNGNGDKALLVTNHVNKTNKSAVFAYEIPNDIVQGTFIKHTLWSDIKTVKKGFGQASPGKAMSVSISEDNTKKGCV